MVKPAKSRLGRDDWLKAALKMCETGIDAVKVAPLATRLGVTTGSFYWHFRNRPELLDALLEYWEREMTDAAIDAARQFAGSPADRILRLMEAVTVGNLARYDLPIWLWAQSDARAQRVFRRVLKKRFAFATWMFSEVGFSDEQAEIRGHMMIADLMGESTLIRDSIEKRMKSLTLKYQVLMTPDR